MKLSIKYFGMIAETIGKQEDVMDIPSNQVTVLEISKIMLNNNPKLENMSFKVAVNQNIAEDNTLINDGDEIALLPPFAGG